MTPAKEIKPVVQQAVEKVLAADSDHIHANTPLAEYGLNSLRAMEIIVDIEDAFDIEASDIEIAMLHTLDDLVTYVERKLTGD